MDNHAWLKNVSEQQEKLLWTNLTLALHVSFSGQADKYTHIGFDICRFSCMTLTHRDSTAKSIPVLKKGGDG